MKKYNIELTEAELKTQHYHVMKTMTNYQAIKEFILEYLEPKPKYSGVSAHELTMLLMAELNLSDDEEEKGEES